jgi:mono/diheme cytochrome c family protein
MRIISTGLALALTIVACSATEPPPDDGVFGSAIEDAPPVPELDVSRVAAGQDIYLQTCAVCHRPDLSGADDWKVRDDEGRFKPPPLDSTGHAWHHPDSILAEIIRDGSSDPESDMNGFGGELTDDEIGDVVEFLKSYWGPEERSFQWFVTWQESQP